MRKYILIVLAAICGWAAPSAQADRLVSQEPRLIHRRTVVEREFLPDYYTNDERRVIRTTRVRDIDDDDDDDFDPYRYDYEDDDNDDDARVIVRPVRRVERRVIIRD